MASIILLALLSCVVLYGLKLYRQFVRNLADAKASGITYTIIPFYHVNRLYQLSLVFIEPAMRALPKQWTDPWFDLTLEWGWFRRYEPFKRFGADTFITVSPERNTLYTAEADVIAQISNRRADFPKAVEVYKSLNIYGMNVVSAEGQTWRHHRKITSPPFTEKNNHLVWAETLIKARAMMDGWLGGKTRSNAIRTVAEDAMRLSLHVISRAGFGVEMAWPNNGDEKKTEEDTTAGRPDISKTDFSENHKMSYTTALGTLLHNILTVLLVPHFLLSKPSITCYSSDVD